MPFHERSDCTRTSRFAVPTFSARPFGNVSDTHNKNAEMLFLVNALIIRPSNFVSVRLTALYRRTPEFANGYIICTKRIWAEDLWT